MHRTFLGFLLLRWKQSQFFAVPPEQIEKDIAPGLDASSFNDLKQYVLCRIAERELGDAGHESMRGANGQLEDFP